jgi:uncharacterized membrane protein
VRGFFAGMFLVVFVLVTVLSLRPGGLRTQLRNVARRFKLALLLTGIYLAASTVLRVAFPTSGLAELAMVALAVGLCVTFLLLSQDRPLDPQR